MTIRDTLLLIVLSINIPVSCVYGQTQYKTNQQKKTLWDKTKNWVIGGSVILGAVALAVSGYFGVKRYQDYRHLSKLEGWLQEPNFIPLDELSSSGLLTYKDVKWLLDHGATVEQRPSQRFGPNLLFEAISLLKSDKPRHAGKQEELRKIAQLAVARGVNINERRDSGTALMAAVKRNDVEMVKIVLSGHPDATLRNKEGHDALWFANQNLAEYKNQITNVQSSPQFLSQLPNLEADKDKAIEIIRLIQSYENTPETMIENP